MSLSALVWLNANQFISHSPASTLLAVASLSLCCWTASLSDALSMSTCELLATVWTDLAATSSSRASLSRVSPPVSLPASSLSSASHLPPSNILSAI